LSFQIASLTIQVQGCATLNGYLSGAGIEYYDKAACAGSRSGFYGRIAGREKLNIIESIKSQCSRKRIG